MILKLDDQWFETEIETWILGHSNFNMGSFDDKIQVFSDIFKLILKEDQDFISSAQSEIPSFELGVYHPLMSGDYDCWYKGEMIRIEALKREYEDKIKYIESLKSRDPNSMTCNLSSFSVGQFYRFCRHVMDCGFNLNKHHSVNPTDYSPEAIEAEIKKMIQYFIVMISSYDNDADFWGDIDEKFIDADTKRLNLRFVLNMYFVFRGMEHSVKLLHDTVKDGMPKAVMAFDPRGAYEFLLSKIRSENDLTEFIIDCMMSKANETMTIYHEMLAKDVNNVPMNKKIGMVNAFRVLYGEYFGNEQDKFDDFIEQHRELCLQYFLRTYIGHDVPKTLPFYNLLYHNKKMHRSIMSTITMAYIKEKEKQVYDF